MIYRYILCISLAYIIDLMIGDPPTWPHPVKIIGNLISFLDKKLNTNQKIDGVWMIGIVLLTVGVTSTSIIIIAYKIHFIVGLVVEALMIATTISQKGLKDAALEVYHPLTNQELTLARKKLSYIVGRDTNSLNKEEIIRATIETVAENTTDGITAPIFWAVLAGGPGAMIYRAVNTCDSMVGYKNEQYQNFGWASAKLDDVVNWLPARLTGFLMLYLPPNLNKKNKNSFSTLNREAKKHPSPNSGWTEAAIALSLGIQLGGDNYYQGVLSKATKIGNGHRSLTDDDIIRTVRSMQTTSLAFLVMIMLGAMIYGITNTWS